MFGKLHMANLVWQVSLLSSLHAGSRKSWEDCYVPVKHGMGHEHHAVTAL